MFDVVAYRLDMGVGRNGGRACTECGCAGDSVASRKVHASGDVDGIAFDAAACALGGCGFWQRAGLVADRSGRRFVRACSFVHMVARGANQARYERPVSPSVGAGGVDWVTRLLFRFS